MPRRAGGRTELDVEPATLNWLLYARESEDQEGDAEQVTNQIADLRSFVGQIGGTIGSEYVENDTSAFRKARVPLPDGTYGFRVVRPVWDRAMAELRRGNYNALALLNIDRGMRDPRDLEDRLREPPGQRLCIEIRHRTSIFVARALIERPVPSWSDSVTLPAPPPRPGGPASHAAAGRTPGQR